MQVRCRARAVRPDGTGGSPGCSSLARVCSPWGRCRHTPRPWDCACARVTFFVGSLFFTSASFLQYREAVDALPVRGGHAAPLVLGVGATESRLARLRGSTCRHAVVQLEYGKRTAGQSQCGADRAAGVATRCAGFSRLPRCQRCGVAGCRSRHCRPAQAPGVEDRRDQPGRLCCVRHLGCRGLCHTVERRCLERRAVQSRHPRGSPVLPHRRDSDAESRIHRRLGSRGPGSSSVTPFQQSLKEK